MLLERLGRIAWLQQHGGLAVASYEQAVALLADRRPSAEKAFALAALGQSLMLRDQHRPAERVLRDAIDIARQIDNVAVEGHALCSLGPTLVALGQIDEGLQALDRADAPNRQSGAIDEVCRTYLNRAHSCYYAARYAESAKIAAEGAQFATANGRLRHHGQAIVANGILALTASGRWQQAQHSWTSITEQEANRTPYLELRWIGLLLDQERLDEARPLLDGVLDGTTESEDVQHRAVALLRAGELATAEHRWDDARQLFDDGIAIAARSEDAFYTPRGYAQALRCEADRLDAERRRRRAGPDEIAATHARADQLLQGAGQLSQAAQASGRVLLPEPQAWLATAEIEHRRARARDTPDDWARLAATWHAIGQPYRVALARYHQAELLLRSQADRDLVADIAGEALHIAQRLGADLLINALTSLARRARLARPDRAGDQPPSPSAPPNLTPREVEVLAHLVAGETNRQIAQALFISEKTASVHVTNLLRKLGVTNRFDAAALGARAGIPTNVHGVGR